MRAHRQGRLVLFVGAGASRAAPSCLPDFASLAGHVSREAGVSVDDSETPEQRLEALAKRGINVRAMVHKAISESSGYNTTHEALAALTLAGPSVRIVTTNYDRHLSACLPDATPVHEAPSLPADEDFVGVVHLHGSIRQDSSRLVVTETDFADAYMQPSSGTLAFLQRLFVSQTVLFVGYSLQDTLIKYLLKAMRGRSDLYALARVSDSSDQQNLGVTVIGYGDHDDLPDILNQWAERAGASFADHERWVARIVSAQVDSSGQVPEDDPDPSDEDESYLSEVVADPDLVRIFTRHARGPVWLRWVATRPGTKLFTPSTNLGTADEELLLWFARRYSDDEQTAAEALSLIVENGVRLHETLWLNMAMAPSLRGGANRETANRLMLVLADTAPAGWRSRLLGLLRHCDTPDDDELFLELVDRICAPRVTADDRWRPSPGLAGQFRASGVDPSSDPLVRDSDPHLWFHHRHLAAELLNIVDGHLRRVCRIEAIAGNPDPYEGRLAVEAHDHNLSALGMDFLVDAARDLWDVLAEDLPVTAVGYLQSWAASRWAVLNRLAIYGYAQRSDISADEKLQWLMQHDGWVCDNRLHHEVMQLIAESVPEASESSIEELITQIRNTHEPPDSRIVYNKLGWIAGHAPSSSSAQEAFLVARTANPDWDMFEHPDFLWWAEITTGFLPPQYMEGMGPQDLVDSLLADAADATSRLRAEHFGPEVMPYEWHRVLRTVHEATQLSPPAGLSLLEAITEDPDTAPEASRSLASGVLMELLTSPSAKEILRQHASRIEPLLRALWRTGATNWDVPSRPPEDLGWLNLAGNSWPGQLARLAVAKIDAQFHADPDAWSGLPPHDKNFLEEIITGDSHAMRLAQTACAHRLGFLHDIDPEWSATRILPMMDPSHDVDRAVRCWDAYLYLPQCSLQLLQDGLLEHLIAFAGHVDDCCADAQTGFANLAAGICLAEVENPPDGSPEWLTRFSVSATDATRAAFIRSIAHRLRGANPEIIAAQWRRWMRSYWRNRLNGVPRNLTAIEASALADWVTLLDEDFPAAVDLVLEHPTPLRNGSTLPFRMIDAHQSASPSTDHITQHPADCARLLGHVLQHTDLPQGNRWQFVMAKLAPALKAHTDETAFQPVREQLLRLGWNLEDP